MDFLQALVLGLLQGIFEWLPVSSQGQIMAISMAFFGISAENATRYAIMLHIGTLLSAIVYFRKELTKACTLRDTNTINFLVIAVFATAITGIPCYLILKSITKIESNYLVAIIGTALVAMGALLIFIGYIKKASNRKNPTSKDAILTGLAQGLSVLPGISRSGITVAALLIQKFEAKQALKLSFLLSIPSIAIAEIMFYAVEPFAFDLNALAGMVAAFLSGLLLIHLMIKVAEKINFASFCLFFGIAYISISLFDLLIL
ncbi:MAG: undecaprenyl-diphosphate phosphatase [Candidatus Diapherotrites archaeon]|nr:undecaprenyl-diphosphate phosphatase [Candidatus Diapherotrites archaeon]